MSNINPNIKLFLLPTSFKKVGYALLISLLLFMALQAFSIIHIESEMFKATATSGLLTAFLILAQSKFKNEDERIVQVRLIAWFVSIIYLSVMAIISPFVSFFSDGTFVLTTNLSQVLISMFLFYFMTVFIVNRME